MSWWDLFFWRYRYPEWHVLLLAIALFILFFCMYIVDPIVDWFFTEPINEELL